MIVYELIDFFSDFGGFIGLFLGASCITFIDFAVLYLEKAADRKRERLLKNAPNPTKEVTIKNSSAFG